jgi:SAM-dependent methyltransferase
MNGNLNWEKFCMISNKDKIRKIIKDVGNERKKELRGQAILVELLDKYKFDNVLDIGSGGKLGHQEVFRRCGKEVYTNDMCEKYEPTYLGNFLEIADKIPDNYFDCIWCSHTLEHQLNPGIFLSTIKKKLKDGGILAITVPPMKHFIVAGHVNHWTTGMLLLNLVSVGFDCSEAIIKAPKPEKFKGYPDGAVSIDDPYDISVLVPKKDIDWSEEKVKEMDVEYRKTHTTGYGDVTVYEGCLYLSGAGLQVLKNFFPKSIKWVRKGEKDQQFDGRIGDL